MTDRILVIRLGALGDLVLCFQAFQAIRSAHPDAEIALLTMPAFAAFAKQMPWFDRVLIDPRAPQWKMEAWWKLAREVKHFGPTRVYDLQGKTRQSVLYNLLGGPLFGPEWSGAAPLCSHPRLWPPQPGMHYTDFVAAQLERAGVAVSGNPDLAWLDGTVDALELPKRFAMLIPGCAPGRSYKRWPPENYAVLAERLKEKGIVSLAIGTETDDATIRDIVARAPHVVNLCRQTSLKQVAALARCATYVIGNDTGPTHLAAAAGGRTLALMSDQVDPSWSSPRGPSATWIQGKPLEALSTEEVFSSLIEYLCM